MILQRQTLMLSKDRYGQNMDVRIKYTVLDYNYPVHCHDFYEIEIIIGGSGTHLLNGNTYNFKKGDVFIIKPTDFHSLTVNGNLIIYNIKFDESLLRNATSLNTINLSEDYFANLTDRQLDMVLAAVNALEYETENAKEYNTPMKQILLEYIIISIIRASKKCKTFAQDTQLKNLLTHINKNFRTELRLEDVAQITGYTPSYFSSWFHKTIGITYIEYINDLRLSEAKRLLMSTSNSVTEIGFTVGFSSFSGFLKNFKKKYGTTPSKFRKNLINEP